MSVHIQPARLDGEFWVDVSMDGETRRHGPFPDADKAEIMAVRLAAICRAVNAEVTMAAPRLRRSRQWAKS
jgi:hypothetical protein